MTAKRYATKGAVKSAPAKGQEFTPVNSCFLVTVKFPVGMRGSGKYEKIPI